MAYLSCVMLLVVARGVPGLMGGEAKAVMSG